MKRYLIDTHIFLWLVFDPERVGSKKLEILKDPRNRIFIANISFWEISLKYYLGKLDLSGLAPDELPKVAQKMGIDTLEVNKEVMSSFYKLPKVKNHKDPFDRIIIWRCINDNLTLVSQDNKFSEYKNFGLKIL